MIFRDTNHSKYLSYSLVGLHINASSKSVFLKLQIIYLMNVSNQCKMTVPSLPEGLGESKKLMCIRSSVHSFVPLILESFFTTSFVGVLSKSCSKNGWTLYRYYPLFEQLFGKTARKEVKNAQKGSSKTNPFGPPLLRGCNLVTFAFKGQGIGVM